MTAVTRYLRLLAAAILPLLLTACGQTRYADHHISDAHLRSMVADQWQNQHAAGAF